MLEIQERTLGKEHPDLLRVMNNLAVLYEYQGRCGEAETLHRQTLEILRRTLGDEHPSTLSSLKNLAIAIGKQGRYSDTRALYRTLFEAYRQVHGADDPETLSTLNHFFAASEAAGEHSEAKKLWEEIREGMELKVTDDELPSKPSADYRMRIEEPGEYQLYVRWGGYDGGSDSVYAALLNDANEAVDWYLFQGAAPRPDMGDADADFATPGWETFGGRRRTGAGDPGHSPEKTVMEQPALFLVPAPGEYVLRLLRREGGAAADAFVFQQSHLPAPQKAGPAESPREGTEVFVVKNGTVTIEAEHFSSAPPSWLVLPGEKASETRHKNFRGSGYLQIPE
jgi:hypothetical protein